MSILQGTYGIGANDTRYWSKLKKKNERVRISRSSDSQSKYSRECNLCIIVHIDCSKHNKKKDILRYVVKKQNRHGHQPLNKLQHLKEIYLNQLIYF